MERIGNLKMEEEAFERITVYSSDIKGLTQDLDHVSIKCPTPIRKIIEEAVVYLAALDLLKPAFALLGGTAYFLDALDESKKDLPMIEDKLKRKYLTRTSLTLDVRVIFLKLKTIKFVHLKVDGPKSFLNGYELFQFVQAALIDCPDLTSTRFPHLFKSTKPGLSVTLKESSELCTNKSERNIMIFIVRLHYALSIYNAFRLENNSKFKPVKFDFHTFPQLEKFFTELEYDRNVAMNKKEKKKRPCCETIEIDIDEAPHPMDLFVASFKQFKYDVGSRFEDQFGVWGKKLLQMWPGFTVPLEKSTGL